MMRNAFKRFFLGPFQIQAGTMVVFLLLCRLVAMCWIPLNDTTEARYAEIARKMLETGNWVTPMHDYGVPFWAKPPLSMWLSAFSMKIFGVNELAVRLPSFVLSILMLWLVWNWVKQRSGSMKAMVAVLVLTGSLYFLLDAGTVMTDPTLLFCLTLSMVGFWKGVVEAHKTWGYLFFVGLGLGLLAKGPIALVLVGMPLVMWVCFNHKWSLLWKNLPWITGTLLVFAIALPWYLLAESRTPGFLKYFLVGEHLSRFLESGWQGDKYGIAHKAPLGMIWIYAILGVFPWVLMLSKGLHKHLKNLFHNRKDDNGWISYLLFFTFFPLVFFTFAKNIIYPYAFPILPAFALLFTELIACTDFPKPIQRRLLYLASGTGCLFLIATVLFITEPQWVAKSHKSIIAAWKKQEPAAESALIYWGHQSEFSSQFYSAGKIKATAEETTARQLLNNHLENYVIIHAKYLASFPWKDRLTPIETFKILKNQWTLYRMRGYVGKAVGYREQSRYPGTRKPKV